MVSRIMAVLVVVVASLAPAAARPDRWLHVSVEEDGTDGERVKVNLPLDMVGKVLPLIETDELKEGRIRIDDAEMGGVDLQAMWSALREAPDGDFATLETDGERVRVSRSGRFLLAKVEPRTGGEGEKVDVRLPISVLDALFSSGSDTLDVQAALRVLEKEPDGDLVRIDDGDSRVRIWIDGQNSFD